MTDTSTPPSPAYNFRIVPELFWAVATGVLIAAAEAAISFDESVFAGDPSAWTAALVGTLVRAVGGSILTVLTKGAFLAPGERPTTPTAG